MTVFVIFLLLPEILLILLGNISEGQPAYNSPKLKQKRTCHIAFPWFLHPYQLRAFWSQWRPLRVYGGCFCFQICATSPLYWNSLSIVLVQKLTSRRVDDDFNPQIKKTSFALSLGEKIDWKAIYSIKGWLLFFNPSHTQPHCFSGIFHVTPFVVHFLPVENANNVIEYTCWRMVIFSTLVYLGARQNRTEQDTTGLKYVKGMSGKSRKKE